MPDRRMVFQTLYIEGKVRTPDLAVYLLLGWLGGTYFENGSSTSLSEEFLPTFDVETVKVGSSPLATR